MTPDQQSLARRVMSLPGFAARAWMTAGLGIVGPDGWTCRYPDAIGTPNEARFLLDLDDWANIGTAFGWLCGDQGGAFMALLCDGRIDYPHQPGPLATTVWHALCEALETR